MKCKSSFVFITQISFTALFVSMFQKGTCLYCMIHLPAMTCLLRLTFRISKINYYHTNKAILYEYCLLHIFHTFVCINKKLQTGSCFHCWKHNDIIDRDDTYTNVTQGNRHCYFFKINLRFFLILKISIIHIYLLNTPLAFRISKINRE